MTVKLHALPTAFRPVIALWRMSRPLPLVSVMLVYLLGSLAAAAHHHALGWGTFALGLFALLPVAVSIHYVNEWADFQTDALTQRTPFSGGSGMLPAGWVTRRMTLIAAWIAAAIGALVAVGGLVSQAFPPAAVILLALGGFGGWSYSVGPLRLAWRGWGELDNAVLGGMILPLYGYAVSAGTVTPVAVFVFVPFTLLVFTNLLATTWADRRADAMVGKLTLATRLPVTTLRRLYGWVLISGTVTFVLLAMSAVLPDLLVIATVLVLPVLLWGALTYTRRKTPHPSVLLMVSFLIAQLVGWFAAAT